MLEVSFRVDKILGRRLLQNVDTLDGAWYEAEYRYEQRGAEWWAVLSRVVEVLPPLTPHMFGSDCRLPMMREDGTTDIEAEIRQRRKEWKAINAKTEILHV